MREHPNDSLYIDYKRRVEMEYNERGDVTFVKEYVYDPEEEDEVEREIEHFDVCMYPGKPDMETTKARYSTVKRLLWEESIEGVEYIDWVPLGARRDKISEEREALIATLPLPEIKYSNEPLTAMEAVRRHSYKDPILEVERRRRERKEAEKNNANNLHEYDDIGETDIIIEPEYDPCLEIPIIDDELFLDL